MSNGKKVAPTSTTAQARIRLYQPSQRPSVQEGEWLETSFGRCRVTGRIGQRHADVVEGILHCAEKRRNISDGGIELLVDPARLRKTLSDSRYSMAQIEKLLLELRTVAIEIVTPELSRIGRPIIGGIIDHVKPSTLKRRDPLTGGEREIWRVRLGIALVMLLENDLSLYYDPAPIARLEHGITQAIVRHILTHKHQPVGGWFLDTLIEAVAGPIKGQALWNARRRLKEEAEGLRRFGIEIDGDRAWRNTSNLPHPPDSLPHPPDSLPHPPDSLPHPPDF
jgi:hypothetical protein